MEASLNFSPHWLGVLLVGLIMLVGSVSTFYWLVFFVPEPERWSWWSFWWRFAFVAFACVIFMVGVLSSFSALYIMLLLTAERYMGIWCAPLLIGLVLVVVVYYIRKAQSDDP